MKIELNWSAETKNARGQLVATAAPSQEFWQVWRERKSAVKAAGYSVRKDGGAWVVTRYRDDVASIEASQAVSSDMDIPVPAGLSYLPYQVAGIAYAANRPATLIGDEMGLGKTIQAIGVINATNPSTVLVVCPASLKINWANEMEKWLVADREIAIVNGGGEQIPADPDVVVINYDVLSKHRDALLSRTWGIVVMDEAHYCKNGKAKRTKVATSIKADRKIMLTGTPISNRPIELHPIVDYLAPRAFGSYFQFGIKFAAAYQDRFGWHFDGASNLDELQRQLRQSIMIRRRKADVLTELPAKQRQVIVLPQKGFKAELAREFAGLQDAVANTSEGADIAFEQRSEARHEMALAKADAVVEHLVEIDHPVVVMAHHKDVVETIRSALAAAGRTVVTLTGDMGAADRQASVEAFQAGEADVFIGTIGAAGVGITLTRASHVVFAELDWVPGAISQAEDRCHRIGQQSSVLVQHIVVDGSIDARLAETLVSKQAVLDKALDNVVVTEPVSIDEIAEGVTVKTQPKALPKKTVAELQSCAAALASVCDGALRDDAAGYNGADSALGHSLASRATWSPAQQHLAKAMLKKYRRQLVGLGCSPEVVWG